MAARTIPQEKLETFVDAYCETWNGAKAAREAGYTGSSKVLSESARKLLKRDDVKAMIAARFETKLAEKAATREERQRFWTTIMNGGEVAVSVTTMDGRVVTRMQRPGVGARMKASELLGKSEGDFVKRVDVKHTGQVEIVVILPDNERGVTE